MTTTSTTLNDPVLLQRVYNNHYAGIPPWIFALVFVMLVVVVLAMALALSRNPR